MTAPRGPAVTAGQEPRPTLPEIEPDADPRALRVLSVLTAGLPVTLRTADEPALYTVPAVFSRQVTAGERALIEDPATARRLAEEVGLAPVIEFAVTDRRLMIRNTTLTQLDQGLAAAIGRMLERMESELLEAQDRQEVAAADRLDAERDRLAAVARQADQIRFGPPEPVVGSAED